MIEYWKLDESELLLISGTIDAARRKTAVSPMLQQELHTALWSSFLKTDAGPLSWARVLELLNDNRERIPRPLLGIATWNLLRRRSEPAFRNNLKHLDTLLRYAIGFGLDAVETIYDENRDPLLVLARRYNIVDYRWAWMPQRDLSTAKARLELCIQTDFKDLKEVVSPTTWPTASLFWDEVLPVPQRTRAAAAVVHSAANFQGGLALPGIQKTPKPLPVLIKVDRSDSDFSAVSDFEILEKANVEICRGFLKVEKEPGRPGASRITHEKEVRFAAGPLDNQRVGTLAYWLQADTVGLAFPP